MLKHLKSLSCTIFNKARHNANAKSVEAFLPKILGGGGDALFGHCGPTIAVLPWQRISYLFIGLGLAN